MGVTTIDLAIIAAYLALSVGAGFWVSKLASQSTRSYFLGGNKLPWYALGLSNASGMFDISGTMWMVYLLFVYGMKSIWIPWLWPVFNQIFLMMFLSVWLRRSGVVTGAEWITFRFGQGLGARLSHLVVVVFALVVVLAYLAYGFVGIGKFAATFLPFQLLADPQANANAYGLIIVAITSLYVVKGGLMGVVLTEVLQFFIMTIACIMIGVIAINTVSPEAIAAATPAGWSNPFFGWRLDLDWTGIMPAANQKIAEDGYDLFTFFFLMLLLKGVLQSLAGPAPNYDMQRVLSARTPKEAAWMSGLVNVVLTPRYLLIAGLAVLALVHFMPTLNTMGDDVDFELILPFAMREFVPVGLLGLLIAGLLAAFMSSFAAAVNAAPAYVVNDLYRRYVNPHGEEKLYVRLSILVSALFIVIGTGIGLLVSDLNELIQWLVSALYGGYTAANVLKWVWWRFNGFGYFWGMASGILVALLLLVSDSIGLPDAITSLSAWEFFPILFAITLAASVAGSLTTAPTEREVLHDFYKRTRPWGWWEPVRKSLSEAEGRRIAANPDLARDLVNVVIGICWQSALIAAPMFLVIGNTFGVLTAIVVAGVLSVALKFTWFDKICDYPVDVGAAEAEAWSQTHDEPVGNQSLRKRAEATV
ncbi:sodium:solute symporter family protein [Parvularcula dongshanensis]|uniref:Na+/proline symporter n=1 Tax=Parvularcula dongshanensis TaxID=1173995 RepID=A0A840I661_9PROT|nr:sodium:solute symporter family protein [Parvularcula dongshanensis]MBB4660369.1 Na+/proline symporter [Parvularcula dongshanensis]